MNNVSAFTFGYMAGDNSEQQQPQTYKIYTPEEQILHAKEIEPYTYGTLIVFVFIVVLAVIHPHKKK